MPLLESESGAFPQGVQEARLHGRIRKKPRGYPGLFLGNPYGSPALVMVVLLEQQLLTCLIKIIQLRRLSCVPYRQSRL